MLKKLLKKLKNIIPCLICKNNINETINLYNFFSNFEICYECIKKINKINKIIKYKNHKIEILYEYNSILRELILRWKFFNDKSAQEIIYILFKDYFPLFKSILFPPSKKRKEGFIPFVELLQGKKFFSNTFNKKNDYHQSKNSFNSRAANFKLCDIETKYKEIILIDDVFTSGQTIKRCIDLLRGKGKKYFHIIILSTTQK